jgi:glycosyltransferase involved in cell wall biosynthesis
MRVLHVIDSMRQGGAESVVVEHARHAAPDIDVFVCALNLGGPALEAAKDAGAKTFVLGKLAARTRGLARLTEIVRDERIDIVNGHNATGALYGTWAAFRGGARAVFRTEHTIHYGGRHSIFYPVLEPLITAFTRRVVCVCQAVLESHVSRLPWAARRFVTVANGAPPAPHTRPREAVRSDLGLGPEDRLVLSIGSLTPQKAQHVLLEAFARAAAQRPGARLAIAGEGPLRATLERAVTALGLEGRARLLGSRLDVPDLIEACDLFVLSSEREGLPMTLIEAMRGGRAVVSTRVGGTSEIVADGETGRLVPVGDAAALGAAIGSLLDDPAGAAAMGAAGRRRFGERFTAERMVRETEALYRRELATEAEPVAPLSRQGVPS